MPPCLRYIYRGESLRNGRVIPLQMEVASEVLGTVLLDALRSDEANVPLHRVVPFYYSKSLEGWRRLHAHSRVSLGSDDRIEVMLEAPASPASHDNHAIRKLGSSAAAAITDQGSPSAVLDGTQAGGYFGIGIYNSKSADNVGTLWRSAYMLDAKFLFTIGSRNTWEKSADTHKSWRSVPAFRYDTWASFCDSAPYQCSWVAIEMGGTPLHEFVHPERAVYILGAVWKHARVEIVPCCPMRAAFCVMPSVLTDTAPPV